MCVCESFKDGNASIIFLNQQNKRVRTWGTESVRQNKPDNSAGDHQHVENCLEIVWNIGIVEDEEKENAGKNTKHNKPRVGAGHDEELLVYSEGNIEVLLYVNIIRQNEVGCTAKSNYER